MAAPCKSGDKDCVGLHEHNKFDEVKPPKNPTSHAPERMSYCGIESSPRKDVTESTDRILKGLAKLGKP